MIIFIIKNKKSIKILLAFVKHLLLIKKIYTNNVINQKLKILKMKMN